MTRYRSRRYNDTGFFILAVIGFVAFPFVVPWVVRTADYDTSPVVQYRFKVGLAVFVLYILSLLALVGICLCSYDHAFFVSGSIGVVVIVLAIMELASMYNWKGEMNDFRNACPTNATSSYCSELYDKIECSATTVFWVNKTELIEGKNITRTVPENRCTVDTCYNQAKSWMKYSAMIVWAYMFIIIGFIIFAGMVLFGFSAIGDICDFVSDILCCSCLCGDSNSTSENPVNNTLIATSEDHREPAKETDPSEL